MKRINEMTEQEILALTDEDIQKMQKLAMAEAGIAIIEKPKVPELFEITPPDMVVSSVYLVRDDIGFFDPVEAVAFVEFLKNAKSLVKVDYDYNNAGSGYKYAKDARTKQRDWETDPLEIKTQNVYSLPLYNSLCDYMVQNRKMQEQAKKDVDEYEKTLASAADITTIIREKWLEVREKYERLNGFCTRFTRDYLPLAENNREVAMKFMQKAFCLTEEEVNYINENTLAIEN